MNNLYRIVVAASLLPMLSFANGGKSFIDHGAFLSKEQAVNSYELLPPPPEYKSLVFLNDQANYYYGRSLINSDRWSQAKLDADLSDEGIGSQFSSVVGVEISKENTPKLYNLLIKLRKDIDNSVDYAKNHYMRIRPFVLFDKQTCTPDDEPYLRKSGSYPSGHSTSGWAFALILSEIIPERTENILKKGYEYGQSRVICGAHWQSDVDAGRIMGAAIVAKLQSSAEFNKEFSDVKIEVRNKLKEKRSFAFPL
ncbi:phosphatase PAP2 family protein [Serratia fonticola]|uniref:acid phosphatase n=1 Tax=Serratia fonticola TaxID=47917 RepID=UPI00301D850E